MESAFLYTKGTELKLGDFWVLNVLNLIEYILDKPVDLMFLPG